MRWYDLQSLLPPVYASIMSMYEAAVTENDELKSFNTETEQVFKNFFIQTCDEETIRYWENLLGITPSSDQDLDFRRRVVISFLSTKQAITVGFVRKTMKDLFGEGNYDLRYSPDSNLEVEIAVFDTTFEKIKTFVSWFNKVCPAHIKWDFSHIERADMQVECFVGVVSESTTVITLT